MTHTRAIIHEPSKVNLWRRENLFYLSFNEAGSIEVECSFMVIKKILEKGTREAAKYIKRKKRLDELREKAHR